MHSHIGAHVSSLCFSPAGSPNKHLLVGLSTGDIKGFSHDLNGGPLFTLQQPNSVQLIPSMHAIEANNMH